MNDTSAGGVSLDWQHMPLHGRVLIEASAGTGKTFAIGLIFLRLLLERGLRVEQILVATFTEAAAMELRQRLRDRLIETEHLLRAPLLAKSDRAPADSLAAWLGRLCVDASAQRAALRAIELARTDFDRAPIATIHGLCARIQRDFPLQSAAGLSGETLVDETDLLRECLDDFWRLRYLGNIDIDEREAAVLFSAGPQGLLHDLKALLSRGATPVAADGLAALELRVAELRMPENIAELRRLAEDRSLYQPRKTALCSRLREIVEALETHGDIFDLLKQKTAEILAPEAIDAQQPDSVALRLREHALIKVLIHLRQLAPHRDIFVRGTVLAAAFDYCREQLPLRAQRRNAQTYSMQIETVHSRLHGDDSAQLADCLFEAYPAALIDEFQDTDELQFQIFDRIYTDADGRTRGLLGMIGDPKQAIFAFRGGDIATYLKISARVTQRFSLDVNYRSASALIAALNGLYAQVDGGFDNCDIRYRRVCAAADADAKPYLCNGDKISAPLYVHLFRGDRTNSKGEPLDSLGELQTLALEDCAQRIVELLNDPARSIDGKRVGPGDIAVLLSTNKQIVELREILRKRGVPCVGSGRGNVFDTDIARELRLILYAVINAEDDRAVRGALATRLLGANLNDMRRWKSQEREFEQQLERFAQWRELAQRRGIMAIVETLLSQRGAALLAAPQGERNLTDLRHLGELLAEQEVDTHGLEGLYAWFCAMHEDSEDGDTDAGEARQLRIESDGARVQLLTLHMSKGLQFGIVFLPVPWRIFSRDKQFKPTALYFHDDAGQARVDLGSANFFAHRGKHFREELRERLRLLYVGLTRAVHAVHVYWVDRKRVISTDDDLWHRPAIDELIFKAQHQLGFAQGETYLPKLAQKLGGMTIIEPAVMTTTNYHAPASHDATLRDPRALPALRAFECLHSFSALTRHVAPLAVESAAADENEFVDALQRGSLSDIEPAVEAAHPILLELDAWGGRRFGDAVHKILEHAAPGAIWPQQRRLLATQLALQAVHEPEPGNASADPIESVGRMLDRVRDTDLGEGLRLRELDCATRVTEFEFQFPVHTTLAALKAVCAQHGYAQLVSDQLTMSKLNGMMTGFADLIFFHAGRYHVLDYKTNRLGERLQDYCAAALDAAMLEHHYDLQAVLYSVALHRYLRQRMDGYTPQQHLGESWYLFLRGVGLDSGLGVCRRQWSVPLIDALDALFAGDEARAA